jgi:hypothetical protein
MAIGGGLSLWALPFLFLVLLKFLGSMAFLGFLASLRHGSPYRTGYIRIGLYTYRALIYVQGAYIRIGRLYTYIRAALVYTF